MLHSKVEIITKNCINVLFRSGCIIKFKKARTTNIYNILIESIYNDKYEE